MEVFRSVHFLCVLWVLMETVVGYSEEKSGLEALLPLFRLFKRYLNNALGAENSSPRNSRRLLQKKNVQIVSRDAKFPCNLNITLRSPTVPTSVHQVRPGDIKVVGAMGDSLTAGYGISAASLMGIFHETRGRSFSIGGEGTWRTYLTLPNMLKEFNPNLIGYSLSSVTVERKSQLNVAEGGAVSKNMPYMAKVLVRRILGDSRIDVKKDWKMITLMIGDNDFCSEVCYSDDFKYLLKLHRQDLLEVLRILRNNLPKTIVNLIPPPHLKLLTEMHDKAPICELVHLASCPCLIGLPNLSKRKTIFEFMSKWQQVDVEVSNLQEFDREDFAVLLHPFTLNYTFPRRSDGGFDYSYLSPDCFHFSQKGQARFANDLWNSLLTPFGKKKMDGAKEFQHFQCPSDEHPYIYTRKNSRSKVNIEEQE